MLSKVMRSRLNRRGEVKPGESRRGHLEILPVSASGKAESDTSLLRQLGALDSFIRKLRKLLYPPCARHFQVAASAFPLAVKTLAIEHTATATRQVLL